MNLDADARLKRKYIGEVWQLYQRMTRGHYPDLEFLSKECDVIDLLDNYPDLDVSLRYVIDYYLNHKWESK